MVIHHIQFCSLLSSLHMHLGDYSSNFNSAPYITQEHRGLIRRQQDRVQSFQLLSSQIISNLPDSLKQLSKALWFAGIQRAFPSGSCQTPGLKQKSPGCVTPGSRVADSA